MKNNITSKAAVEKTNHLKKRVIKFAAVYVVMTIMVIVIVSFLNKKESSNLQEIKRVERKINVSNQKINNLNRKINEIKEAKTIWDTLSHRSRNADGLRIDEAQLLIKDLESIYHLSGTPNVNLSPPKELSNIYKSNHMEVISSDVSIKFSGISDETLINFTNHLINEFPGFIQIKNFQLKKFKELDKKTIASISRGAKPQIVNGLISFQWKDFKEIDSDQ